MPQSMDSLYCELHSIHELGVIMEITEVGHVIVLLLVLGLFFCAIERVPGISSPIKQAAQVLLLLFAALYILRHFA